MALDYDRVVAVANPIALAAAIWALRSGVAVDRLRPTAAFLVASTVLAVARVAVVLVRNRRGRARAGLPIAWDVLLKEPIWSRTSDATVLLALAAMVGAAASLAGFPGVGAGISATLALIALAMQRTIERWTPRGLMFAPDGLHLALRDCRFVIAWSDISGVDTMRDGELAVVSILSVRRAMASAVPADDRSRTRVRYAVADGSDVTGRLLLDGALAGVEGRTLARAIGEAAARRSAAKSN